MTTSSRNAIVEEWLREIAPPGIAAFVRPHLPAIVDAVLDGDLTPASAAVEGVVRLHAVHGLTASQSVCFLLSLREILRRNGGPESTSPGGCDCFERLVLVAIDAYVSCRERLWEIRWNERTRSTWLLDRLASSEEGGPSASQGPRHVARRS